MPEPAAHLVRLWRLVRLLLHLVWGLSSITFIFPFCDAAQRQWRIRRWSRELLAIFGVRLQVEGLPPGENARGRMLVANHVSWLDVFLLNAVRPLRFVSKAEVRHWPVAGRLAEATGTLFLERARRRDTVTVNQQIVAALQAGDCLAFFPEGTTTDGHYLKPFLPSLLQPALDAGAEIQPVALAYRSAAGEIDTAPTYSGDLSLAQSLGNLLARRQITARLIFLPPLVCAGESRRALSRQAEQLISSALSLAVRRTEPETPAGPQDGTR